MDKCAGEVGRGALGLLGSGDQVVGGDIEEPNGARQCPILDVGKQPAEAAEGLRGRSCNGGSVIS